MGVRHPEFVIGAATLVCLPMVPGLLGNEISPIDGAERFLLALVVCWVIGAVLAWIAQTYGPQAQRRELERMTERSDWSPADPDPTE